jgi:hypothetical protein
MLHKDESVVAGAQPTPILFDFYTWRRGGNSNAPTPSLPHCKASREIVAGMAVGLEIAEAVYRPSRNVGPLEEGISLALYYRGEITPVKTP